MRPRIIHVTEAFGGGVFQMVAAIARQQAKSGTAVTVIATRRPDSPTAAQVRQELGENVDYIEVGSAPLWQQLPRLAWATYRALAGRHRPLVHVHSSFAGAAIRGSSLLWFNKADLVYSPHGFAFLRLDLSRAKRQILRLTERLLTNLCAGLVLVSESESEIAREALGADRVVTVENTVDLHSVPVRPADQVQNDARPLIVTSGRVVYQKAPWLFAQLAQEFAQSADFLWLGDGDPARVAEWLGSAPNVMLSGWLSHEEVLVEIGRADVFVMTSLWEGMPVALIEAQCMGLPAVVTDCIGNRDVVVPGVTGFVAESPDEMRVMLGQLITNPAQRQAMGKASLRSRDRFSEERLAPELSAAYELLLRK
jgi:glycosyltransferase involved in cell wall biosynthesis